ncbi:hypothetical protein J6W20_02360 [bacterium]|nr:hypothetical protein [bacterium]
MTLNGTGTTNIFSNNIFPTTSPLQYYDAYNSTYSNDFFALPSYYLFNNNSQGTN